MEKKCKKAKWLSEEALQIAVKRRAAKSKGEKERYKHLNAEFQRIARDKKAFLSDQCKDIEEYSLEGLKLKLQYFGHLMQRAVSFEKTLMLGKIEGRRRRGRQRMDEMVGWHHRLNGQEFEQAPGDGKGQGRLACCSPWGLKESDTPRHYTTTNTSSIESKENC